MGLKPHGVSLVYCLFLYYVLISGKQQKKEHPREESKGEREKTKKPTGVFWLTFFFLEARLLKRDFLIFL
jgi:hypothetical protein